MSGRRAVDRRTDEIVAARALLGCLDLGGTLVTADAKMREYPVRTIW